MRTTKLFQIRDNVANSVVGPIISAYHEAAAIRHFTDLLKNPETTIASHPEDFDLMYLGNQEETTGEIDPLVGVPQIALSGSAWKSMQERAQSPAAMSIAG